MIHTTRLEYTADVVEGVTEARLGPYSDAHQHWQHFDLQVTPRAAVNQYVDGFGNTTHQLTVASAHEHMEIVARSFVDTLLVDPFQPPHGPVDRLSLSEMADYLSPSALVPRIPELSLLAARFAPRSSRDSFEAVRQMMSFVYEQFEYTQLATTVSTAVGEVLLHRRGVCQDFAHVLIGLCRAIEIPARYVGGYIVAFPDNRKERRGTQASHAWAEVFTPTHSWRGFDPTNNLVASEYHVKMAVGRDYRDVPPTRGTYRGDAAEQLSVVVKTAVP